MEKEYKRMSLLLGLIDKPALYVLLVLHKNPPLTRTQIRDYIIKRFGERYHYTVIDKRLILFAEEGLVEVRGGAWSLSQKGKELASSLLKILTRYTQIKGDEE